MFQEAHLVMCLLESGGGMHGLDEERYCKFCMHDVVS